MTNDLLKIMLQKYENDDEDNGLHIDITDQLYVDIGDNWFHFVDLDGGHEILFDEEQMLKVLSVIADFFIKRRLSTLSKEDKKCHIVMYM